MMRTIILFSTFCLLFAGCKREIDLVVEGVEPRLVIEANLNATSDFAYVSLTKTTPINDPSPSPTVSDAVVVIKNLTTGTDHPMQYNLGRGWYAASGFGAKPGDVFQLSVDYNGVNYVASCPLMSSVTLDGVTIKDSEFAVGSKPLYDVIPHFTDPSADQRNYYHFRIGVNDKLYTKIFVMSNAFSGGMPNTQPLRVRDIEFIEGDTVTVIMERVAPVVYQYYFELLQASRKTGDHPSNPTSNITGGALGYFSAFYIEVQRVVYEK